MNKELYWQNSTFSPPEINTIYQTLPGALAEIALKWPDSPAVITEGKMYTFRRLACRAAGLAEEINEAGFPPGPVALIQKAGLDAIAAWFACSLASRPFLLPEPDYPTARLIDLIKRTGCVFALVDYSTSHLLVDSPKIRRLISDGRSVELLPNKGLHPEEPAMLFPTSGSTGTPKLITYATTTIQVKVQSSIQLMRVPQGARVLIAGSHGNYGFLHHALVFLLSGNAVCLEDVKVSGFNAIFHAIHHLGVRHIRFTPSLFRELAVLPKAQQALRLLDAVRFSGEPLLRTDLQLAQSVLSPECLIQNIYGSTESSLFIWSNTDKNLQDDSPTVPIGRIYPLSSFAIRPLNDADENDSRGELLIRSHYHALGDFHDGIIDKERFPVHDGSTDERIYATGDVVQLLPDGNMIHLGRLGRMVKIRGNRVFLTEVEHQLHSLPDVTGAAVVDRVEQNQLVLYGFVTTESTDSMPRDLRAELAAKLPDFMIPVEIKMISRIPLLNGGKVDYQALISLIPTFDSTDPSETIVTDFDRLIQLWESVLWKGAHTYISDFFSLGGDSLRFMVLMAEVEKYFGVNLRAEELRSNCTLQTLADILGIETTAVTPVIRYKSLEARLYRSAMNFSKGIALAMPGIGGLSNAFPFHKAGFFQDHDMWVVEFPIHKGNMLQENRWSIATLEIVQGIREGILPTPRVVFGFSFDGGLAWLVGRLLAGLPQCPNYVVMVDAPPLHRRSRFMYHPLRKALKTNSAEKLPPVLHLCRAPLVRVLANRIHTREWSQKDGILCQVDLPTVDHLDMKNWEILALAKEAVVAFLNAKEVAFEWKSVVQPPDVLGCAIFYAFHGDRISLQHVLDKVSEGTDITGKTYLQHLVVLMYTMNEPAKSEELCRLAVQKWPDSEKVRFLHRRIRRDVGLLFSGDVPTIYPRGIIEIENNLASRRYNSVTPKSLPVRFLFLAYDVSLALLAAKFKIG